MTKSCFLALLAALVSNVAFAGPAPFESLNGPNLITSPKHAGTVQETLQIPTSSSLYLKGDGTLSCGDCKNVMFSGRIIGITGSITMEITDYSKGNGYQVTAGVSGLCGGAWAVPIPGAWNPDGSRIADANLFTFACHDSVAPENNSAAYKCAKTLGYDPNWTTPDYFQACTRMIRADYCGSGKSHTITGEHIDIEDTLGHSTWSEPTWLFEAAWNENGAICVNVDRVTGSILDAEAAEGCIASKVASSCSGILMNKTALDRDVSFPASCLRCGAGSSCTRCGLPYCYSDRLGCP